MIGRENLVLYSKKKFIYENIVEYHVYFRKEI